METAGSSPSSRANLWHFLNKCLASFRHLYIYIQVLLLVPRRREIGPSRARIIRIGFRTQKEIKDWQFVPREREGGRERLKKNKRLQETHIHTQERVNTSSKHTVKLKLILIYKQKSIKQLIAHRATQHGLTFVDRWSLKKEEKKQQNINRTIRRPHAHPANRNYTITTHFPHPPLSLRGRGEKD